MDKEELEECESGYTTGEGDEEDNHTCIEPKGHEGPHICYACSEQW